MATRRRPLEERQDLCAKIIEAVGTSDRGLRAICEDAGFTVGRFLAEMNRDPALAEQYAIAKRMQAEMLAAEIVSIADETEVKAFYDGEEVRLDLSPTAIARNRLRIDARKWVAAKLLPKVYGDKIAVGGADDLPPMQVETLDPTKLSSAALAEILAAKK